MTSGASLVLDGTIELIDQGKRGPYWFKTLADDASFGSPAPIEVAIASMLRDGTVMRKVGDDNRELGLSVRVCSTDGRGLDAGVAALHRATGKRTTLAWTPPDDGETRVFAVETSSLHSLAFNDLDRMVRHQQVYQLRLVALPYSRSAVKVVDTGGTPPTTGTLIDGCESVTGWSAADSTATVDTVVFHEGAGSVKIQAGTFKRYEDQDGDRIYYSRNIDTKVLDTPQATGAGGYLMTLIKMEWPHGAGRDWDNVNYRTINYPSQVSEIRMTTLERGHEVVTATAAVSYADGFVGYVWQVDADLTVTELRYIVEQRKKYFTVSAGQPQPTFDAQRVWYDSLVFSDVPAADREVVRTFDIDGSARAPGALHIASPSDAVPLGQVLLATYAEADVPAGFRPDVRRWYASGETITDASAPHGSAFALGAGYSNGVFEIPAAILAPGPHAVFARVKGGANPLKMSARASLVWDTTELPTVSEASVSIPNNNAGWQIVPLGTMYLPPVPVMNPDADMVVRLEFAGSGLSFDDAFVCPQVADVTIVDCGTGPVSPAGASSHLWVDSPSPSQRQGGYWQGIDSQRGNARSAWPDLIKPGVHSMVPPRMVAFLTSSNAQGPSVTPEYFPHWL